MNVSLSSIWAAIAADPMVLTIPFVSGFIGWFTNVVAVKMMLYPIQFVGIPPYLGWRGIIPANARRLAVVSIDIISKKLVSLSELFAQFSRDAFASEVGPIAKELTERVIDEVARKKAPQLWDNLGEFMQEEIRKGVEVEVAALVTGVAEDLSANIEQLVDMQTVAVDAVTSDPSLMGQLFLDVGKAEFKFIEVSGFWFGLLFGVPQMLCWIVYPEWWTLPVAGLVVGYVTNWLALKLIFEPQEPKRYGPFVVQGLFHKRKNEVAEAFARVATEKILSPDNMVAMMQRGESRARLTQIVQARAVALLDKYEDHPMASMAFPEDERPALREEVLRRIDEELPTASGFLRTFAGRAVDMKGTIVAKMKALDAASFEGVLRPAFQADEWKLIVVGAVLGLIAGQLQAVYVFGSSMP